MSQRNWKPKNQEFWKFSLMNLSVFGMKLMKTVDILNKYRQSQLRVSWLEDLMTRYQEKNIQDQLELEVIINDNMDVCVRIQAKEMDDDMSQIYLYMTWDDDFKPNQYDKFNETA